MIEKLSLSTPLRSKLSSPTHHISPKSLNRCIAHRRQSHHKTDFQWAGQGACLEKPQKKPPPGGSKIDASTTKRRRLALRNHKNSHRLVEAKSPLRQPGRQPLALGNHKARGQRLSIKPKSHFVRFVLLDV
jgi:hypothetical protein